jgi:formylglycine-generating enzyme required for sulfatase activity
MGLRLRGAINKLGFVFCGLLFSILGGCDQSSDEARAIQSNSSKELDDFVEKIKDGLIFVGGGEFLMGDYGEKYGPEKLPYDLEAHSKPLHKVGLAGFSIGKFKITNQEYKIYLKYNGLDLKAVGKGNQKDWQDISMTPNTPAHMDWYEAEKYCAWLEEISGLPFALPTEAQWEYAARSRGQFLMVATDDGTYRATNTPSTEDDGPRGINISSSTDRIFFAKKMGWKTGSFTPLPVDSFPPNPLGLYAMSDNGLEWVKDWYDPKYYQSSPAIDPQGPSGPVFKDYFQQDMKVARGQAFANPIWGGGANIFRTAAEPNGYAFGDGVPYLSTMTARCVVNGVLPGK